MPMAHQLRGHVNAGPGAAGPQPQKPSVKKKNTFGGKYKKYDNASAG